jgi:hypothetical protein
MNENRSIPENPGRKEMNRRVKMGMKRRLGMRCVRCGGWVGPPASADADTVNPLATADVKQEEEPEEPGFDPNGFFKTDEAHPVFA